MAYNYPNVFNFLSLQHIELESIMAETRKALEALEHTRYLLEQHQQTTLRLQEVSAKLNALDHRMVEIAENQHIFDQKTQNKARAAGVPLGRALYLQSRRNVNSSQQVKNEPDLTAQEMLPAVSKTQMDLAQLELINVQNQHAAQEARRNQLETELKELEAQLSSRGFREDFL